MKREILILNIICVVMALLFIAFAVYNVVTAESLSSFITVDNLFATAFCLLMALVFISVPGLWVMSHGGVRNAFKDGEVATATPARTSGVPAKVSATNVQRGTAVAATSPAGEIPRDAKGRPIPADVNRMAALLNKSEEKSS